MADDPVKGIRDGVDRMLNFSAVGLVKKASETGGRILDSGREVVRKLTSPRKVTSSRSQTGKRR